MARWCRRHPVDLKYILDAKVRLYSYAVLTVAVLAAVSAFVIAKKRERRPGIWALLCFLSPAFLPYLVQLQAGEKPTRDFLTRFVIAGVLLGFSYSILSSIRAGNSFIPAYENLLLNNISSVLDVIQVSHFRDGSYFKTPYVTFQIPNGATLFYFSFLFAAMALILSVFLRKRQPYTMLSLGSIFFIFGHLVSVGVVATIAATLKNSEQLTNQSLVLIGDICKSSGWLLLYVTVLAIAFRTSRRNG
jgi:hypothetical protein